MMDLDKLNEKLNKTLRLLPAKETNSFILIAIGLGGKRKPIVLLNSMRDVYYSSKPFGIVLQYAADPRNLHDREVFNRLKNSSVFDGFSSDNFGYEGKSFHKFFGMDKAEIIENIRQILITLDDLIILDECNIQESRIKDDQSNSNN